MGRERRLTGPLFRASELASVGYARFHETNDWSESMRLSYRLILSLIAGVTAVSVSFAMYQATAEMHCEADRYGGDTGNQREY